MPALVAGIHVFLAAIQQAKRGRPRRSPAMTTGMRFDINGMREHTVPWRFASLSLNRGTAVVRKQGELLMATLDIRGTVVGETAIAIKAPCLVATTGNNITLSGAQTIDGVAVSNNSERVLVKDQTTASQNGIYIASTG